MQSATACRFVTSSQHVSPSAESYDDWGAVVEGNQKRNESCTPIIGMHPTANSAAFIRERPCLLRCVRGG